LEAPQYSHPVEFAGQKVPDVLLSGNHADIARYRRREQLKRTALQRPDLLLKMWDSLTRTEQKWIESFWRSSRA
jgi:tRNA (guanine37-N1)-methyltransferase